MPHDGRPTLGVSACLLDDEGRVLLVRRARPPYSGLLSLPGGRVEFGETLSEAVRREIAEETGLEIANLLFATLHEAIGEGFHAVVAVHAGRMPVGTSPRASDDAASIEFADVAEIARAEARGETTPGLLAAVRNAIAALQRSEHIPSPDGRKAPCSLQEERNACGS